MRSPLTWLLILALALRLAAGAWWQARLPPGTHFAFADSESYWALGHAIARGEPYEFGVPPARVFRAPGYPLALAGLFLVAGDETPVGWARALGALLGTAAVWGVYRLGLALFDRRTALVAAALAAIYPGAIAMSVFVLSEAVFCPLLVVQLIAAAAAWRGADALRRKESNPADPEKEVAAARSITAASLAWATSSGALAGAATLARPSWLLFVPFVVLAGLLTGRNLVRHACLGTAMLAGLIVMMAPWWVRNQQATGHFVPTTLQVGASLYDGLNPRATGASDMTFVPEFVAEVEQDPAAGESLEYRLDRRLRQASLEWAATHPGRALQLAVIKFVRLWNIWPNEAEFRSWPMRMVVCATYVPVLALALIGAARILPRGWPYPLLWLPAVYLSLLHMVFVSSIRYRDPAMLPLAVLAAAALVFPNPTDIGHSEHVSPAVVPNEI